MPLVQCGNCQKESNVRPSRLQIGRGKYCSRKCEYEAKSKMRKLNSAPKPKLCALCKEQPVPTKRHTYCSHHCRDNAQHLRKTAKASQPAYGNNYSADYRWYLDGLKYAQIHSWPFDNPEGASAAQMNPF